ncbi:MAG: transposase [Actinomycetota bacterium]|nr:transposase [Actinomycetota bacterium]
MSGVYEGKQIVGMDLHRRRSVLVRMTEAGDHLETVRISNDPEVLGQVMARAGEAPEVVLEATYGWYWAADALAELGANVHLAHPLGVKMFSYRRVKNDERDAADLADLLGDGSVARSLDFPTGDPGAARLGAPPRQAGRATLEPEVPGTRGARRRRSAGADE